MKIKNLQITDKMKALLKKGTVFGLAVAISLSLSGCGDKSIQERNEETLEIDDTVVRGYYTALTDEDIQSLPSTVERITINGCHYILSLDSLPETCPNIKSISLDSCSGITDLSFLEDFDSLERVYINDMAGVSHELVDSLREKGIEVEIEEEDIVASEMIQKVLDEIITEDMTDEDKIREITLFVSRQCKYKLTNTDESNLNPLTTTLIEGKGVCAGIAYTTNVLLRSAGVESYEVTSDLHAWNLIELDGKYYYLDVTNLGSVLTKPIARFVLQTFGVGFGYMADPNRTALTATTQYDDRSVTLIPQSLIEDIARGEDEKSLFEKYGSSIPLQIIVGLIALVGITTGIGYAARGIQNLTNNTRHQQRHGGKYKGNHRRSYKRNNYKRRRR